MEVISTSAKHEHLTGKYICLFAPQDRELLLVRWHGSGEWVNMKSFVPHQQQRGRCCVHRIIPPSVIIPLLDAGQYLFHLNSISKSKQTTCTALSVKILIRVYGL